MSFESVRYTPEWRHSLVALLARVGTTQLTDEEFAWWFDRRVIDDSVNDLAAATDSVEAEACRTVSAHFGFRHPSK